MARATPVNYLSLLASFVTACPAACVSLPAPATVLHAVVAKVIAIRPAKVKVFRRGSLFMAASFHGWRARNLKPFNGPRHVSVPAGHVIRRIGTFLKYPVLSITNNREKIMISKLALVGALCASVIAAANAPSFAADLTPQTMAKVDVTSLGTAYRASKIIGASIVNSANDTVGKVDDLLVSPKDHALYAVVSVGGFLGMGSKLIAVPYQNLQMSDTKFVLPNATKDELKALPEFKYASK